MSWLEAMTAHLTAGDLGGFAAIGVAFVGGLVAGFGPCVLPMLPAVFGYVTGRTVGDTENRRTGTMRALGLSAVFVLGMSLLFAGIGVLAALLGRGIFVGTWGNYVAAAVCVALGLHMLGLVDLRFDRMNRWLPSRRPKRAGYGGAFFFGMLFGLVASPCSTPVLAAIATMAALDGSAPFGALLLFAFGVGKGVPLLLVGLASGVLPRLGGLSRAADVLTRVAGAVLLGAAAYLVWTA